MTGSATGGRRCLSPGPGGLPTLQRVELGRFAPRSRRSGPIPGANRGRGVGGGSIGGRFGGSRVRLGRVPPPPGGRRKNRIPPCARGGVPASDADARKRLLRAMAVFWVSPHRGLRRDPLEAAQPADRFLVARVQRQSLDLPVQLLAAVQLCTPAVPGIRRRQPCLPAPAAILTGHCRRPILGAPSPMGVFMTPAPVPVERVDSVGPPRPRLLLTPLT